MFYYQSVVRPVLEYASPCWHLNLTKEQTKQLEDVQRRALQVIFSNIPYDEVRRTHNIPTLAERRLDLSRTFSRGSAETTRMSSGISCQPSVILNLRLDCVVLDNNSTIYARTNRYKNSHYIWTKSLAVISVPSLHHVYVLCNFVCLCNPALLKAAKA